MTIQFSRKVLIVRIATGTIVFLMSWLLLSATGSLLIDKTAILKWIGKQNWIKFLNPAISGFLLLHGWQIIISIVLAIYSYLKSEKINTTLVAKYFTSKVPFSVEWQNVTDTQLNEFILFIGTGSNSLAIALKNTGFTNLKINQVKITPSISKGTKSKTGNDIAMILPQFTFNGQGENGDGMEMVSSGDGKWVINTPFLVKENAQVVLPMIELEYDEENKNIIDDIWSLAGDASLMIEFDIVFKTDEASFKRTLSAPLRVFFPFEDWDEGFTDLNTLMENIGLRDEAARTNLMNEYIKQAREQFEIRTKIAEHISEVFEEKLLKENEPEIALLDEAVKENPLDPTVHFNRGRTLVEMGIVQEAFVSFYKALELHPGNNDIQINIAGLFNAIYKPKEALEWLKKIKVPPADNPLFFETRASAYDATSNPEAALKDYETLIQLRPEEPGYYVNQAVSLVLIDNTNTQAIFNAVRSALDKGYANFESLATLHHLLEPKDVLKFRALIAPYEKAKKDAAA
ncbi:MAG: hypothetical protein ABIR15_20290 [Chitinophagaceae bacterium]